jgi:hypothetical protein
VTSQTLVKVSLTYDAQGKPSFGSKTEYPFNIKDINGNPVTIFDMFGDIAMDPSGKMYLANTGTTGTPNSAAFYTLDTNTLVPGGPNTATVIKGPAGGNPSLQLSYSCDYKTLWAQSFETCQWYTIDPATGIPTAKFKIPLVGVNTCLRDLGGAACTCARGQGGVGEAPGPAPAGRPALCVRGGAAGPRAGASRRPAHPAHPFRDAPSDRPSPGAPRRRRLEQS